MKLKTTKEAIKREFSTIYSIGYCAAQFLLYYKSPFAYSERAEGWACDYYEIWDKCISTGYNPIGQNLDYSKLSEAEKQAQAIVLDSTMGYGVKVQKVDALLNELLSLS